MNDAVTAAPTPGSAPAAATGEVLLAAGVPEEFHHLMGPLGLSPLAQKMGITFTHMAVERLVATMPVAGNEQNAGLLHGGAHLVLAETLGSIAAVLHVDGAKPVVGIEISATHHRAIREGLVTGTCTPIHLGGTLTTHEIVMTDEAGRRLSTAKITNMVLDPARRQRGTA